MREWFYQMWPQAKGWGKGWGHAAAFDTRLGCALARTGGACYGIARKLRGHGYELVKNAEGYFILDAAYGPLRAGEIERAKEWGAQVVRTSVAKNEGWAIWDDS